MPLLVTGGAGFIGSHLIDRLLNEGHEVVCLDDFNPFYNPDFKRENVAPYIENPKFTLFEGDLRDESGLKKLFQKQTFQQVIHLAARGLLMANLSFWLVLKKSQTSPFDLQGANLCNNNRAPFRQVPPLFRD